jgi:hypothetical protein
MKLTDILQEDVDIAAIENLPIFQKFKNLQFTVVSTPRQIKNGTFEISQPKDIIKNPDIIKMGVKISRTGNIYFRHRSNMYPSSANVAFIYEKDDLTFYQKALERAWEEIEKRLKLDQKQRDKNAKEIFKFDPTAYYEDLTFLNLPAEQRNLRLENINTGSFLGLPKKIPGECRILLAENNVNSLEHLPAICGDFRLALFKSGLVKASDDQLKYVPARCEYLWLDTIGFTSFAGIGKILKRCQNLYAPTTLASSCLGILLIPKIDRFGFNRSIDATPIKLQLLNKIINTHLGSDKDILECKTELIENGLKEFAKL